MPTLLSYVINSIAEDGAVDVTFNFSNGTVNQNISGLPISDSVQLKDALVAYANAYLAGKAVEEAAVAPEVQSLVGKPQTV